jgi:uncharacterized membrane protein YGL010W
MHRLGRVGIGSIALMYSHFWVSRSLVGKRTALRGRRKTGVVVVKWILNLVPARFLILIPVTGSTTV